MYRKISVLFFLGLVFAFPSVSLAATLSFSPATGTFNKGCTQQIKIELDTASLQVDGVDAIINFDPSKLSTTVNNITAGNTTLELLGNTVDNATKRIIVSGLAPLSQAYSGKGTLATISFTVPADASEGATQLTFFVDQANPTKDSNIVERGSGQDILTAGSVVPGNYVIGSGACGTVQPASTPAPQAGGGKGIGSAGTGPTSALEPKQPTLDEIAGGVPGTFETTMMLAAVGGILVILGLVGLALL